VANRSGLWPVEPGRQARSSGEGALGTVDRLQERGARARSARHQALLDAPARFAQLLDRTHDGIAWIDSAGRIDAWNEPFESLVQRGELLRGAAFGSIVENDGRLLLEAAIARILAGRTLEETVIAAAGHNEIEIQLGPVAGTGGGIEGASAVVRSVTTCAPESRAALAAEARLRVALEAAHLGVWRWDLASERLEWSTEAGALVGGSVRSSEGGLRDVLEWIHPADRHMLAHQVGQTLEGTGAFRVEVRSNPPEGEPRWLEVVGRAQRDASGAVTELTGALVDIDVRKRAEIAYERALEREQTARAEAERASKAKDEFLSVLSHELRTPLHTITLSLDVLDDEEQLDGPSARTAIDVIRRSSEMQTRLVQDLLDLTRSLVGRLRIERRPVSIRPLLGLAVVSARAAAVEKRLTIRLHAVRGLGRVSGDPERLTQVFGNLLSNAVKFSPRNGEIDVEATRRGSSIVICVRDRGEGIAREDLGYVFDRFWTADSSTTRRHGGLGLGLAIAKQIIDQHAGTIAVESAGPGQGATFTVRLTGLPP